jgi:hypothetical protein
MACRTRTADGPRSQAGGAAMMESDRLNLLRERIQKLDDRYEIKAEDGSYFLVENRGPIRVRFMSKTNDLDSVERRVEDLEKAAKQKQVDDDWRKQQERRIISRSHTKDGTPIDHSGWGLPIEWLN